MILKYVNDEGCWVFRDNLQKIETKRHLEENEGVKTDVVFRNRTGDEVIITSSEIYILNDNGKTIERL